MKGKINRKDAISNLKFGFLFVIVSIFYIIFSFQIPNRGQDFILRSTFFPFLLGSLLLIVSTIFLIKALKEFKKIEKSGGLTENKLEKNNGNYKVYLLLLVIGIITMLLEVIGFFLGGLILVGTIQYISGVKPIYKILIYSTVIVGFVNLVFVILLKLPLPKGLISFF